MAESEEYGILSATAAVGSGGMSISSGSSSGSSSSFSVKTALNDCSTAWIAYLNNLNNLCSSGIKLSNSIAVLEQCGSSSDKSLKFHAEKESSQHPSVFLTNAWSDLARATAVATSTVKSHIMAVLQDFVALSGPEMPSVSSNSEMEQKRIRDHNELIVLENAQTLINVQHQFCAANYEAFSSLTCCFVCQSPVGFPHEQDCTVIKQKSTNSEQRSQTPSPHFGGSIKIEASRGNPLTEQRPISTTNMQAQKLDQVLIGVEQSRGSSPQQNFRDTIPLQAIFENTRGPLPNPGHLLSMKIPFYRNAKSPLNFPLFPLNGQRRWSEAAAGKVTDENLTNAESQMRRWSMPWEASKTDKNTVTWCQTRIMPVNSSKLPHQKMFPSERSSSNTPDSNWQSSITSQDGLTEAIQLLSCRPTKNHPAIFQHSDSSSVD